MRDRTLGQFFFRQRHRITASLRRSARVLPEGTYTRMTPRQHRLTEAAFELQDVPESYLSRGELARSTDFEYRR